MRFQYLFDTGCPHACKYHKLLIMRYLCVFLLVLSAPIISWAQLQGKRGAEPSIEEELRQHLRKLDRWGIVQLLRVEQAVDEKQKKRARSTSNPEELALLAEDEDDGVRFYVASNRNIPLDVQLHLADDSEAFVRGGIALSLNYTPLDSKLKKQLITRLALKLTQDDTPIVRLGLAGNKRLPDEAYETLARDIDPIIRQKLGENINLPRSALAILAQDSLVSIRATALRHANIDPVLLKEMSADVDASVRKAIANNTNVSTAILDQLSTDTDIGVRLAVAQHPNTRTDALVLLAADADLAIQLSVAQHPHAGRDLLLSLVDFDRDISVRQVARERLKPILRGEIREDVLERWETR